MKKIYYYIIIILILGTLAFLGIFTKYNKKDTLNKITVAEVTHSAFYAPFYVSLHNNYFKDENLDIEVILTSGADKVASAVLSGDAQIGLSGLEATIYVYLNKQKDYLVNFSSLTKRDGQFLLGDCKLKDNFNLNMLKDSSILVGRSGGMPSMVFNYALYKNNVDKSNITIDTSVEFASLSGAFIGKQAEFVNLFEPTATMIEKEGYGCVLASLGKLSGELPYTVFHTKKSYLENNKSTITQFKKAIDKGLKYVKESSSKEIAELIKDEFPSTSLIDLTKVIDRYKESDSWWDNSYIEEYAYNNLIELMEYNGVIDITPSYSTLVYNE